MTDSSGRIGKPGMNRNSEQFVRLPFAEIRRSSESSRLYKPHIHPSFVIGAIDRGSVLYRIGGREAVLSTGSLALINPGVLHSCNPGTGESRSYSVLFLDRDWCIRIQNSLWEGEGFRPAGEPLLEDPVLYRRLNQVLRTLLNERTDPLEQEEILAELAEKVFLKACRGTRAPQEPSGDVEAMRLRLESDLDLPLTLEELSRDLRGNPFTLLRQFRSSMGITPHAYRLNCRIEKARQLLRQNLELSRVALECGFFDQSHFHRHFKAATAVTPREYQINFIQ